MDSFLWWGDFEAAGIRMRGSNEPTFAYSNLKYPFFLQEIGAPS